MTRPGRLSQAREKPFHNVRFYQCHCARGETKNPATLAFPILVSRMGALRKGELRCNSWVVAHW
jgi:hypothetical protein